MDKCLTTIALLGYASTCIRLLCYQRGLANYQLHMSLLAWLLIVFTGTNALEILLDHSHVSLGQAGIAIILGVLVHRVHGNIATIIRGTL